MKKYMRNPHLILVYLLLPAFIAGCIKEDIQESDGDNKVAFRLNTKAIIGETLSNVTIKSIRVLIVDPNMGNNIVVNRLINSQDEQPSDFVFQLKQGRYKICVVANETGAMTPFLTAAGRLSDVDAITVITPKTESNLVLYQAIDIILRTLASNAGQTEVSVDGGTNWISPPVVNVSLERVASKISLAIKKMTINDKDKFDIKGIELINLASNSHLLPGHVYSEGLHTDTPFKAPSIVSFINNDDVKPIFKDYIVSEYLLSSPTSSADAAALVITADYTKFGGTSQEVIYTVPVLGQTAIDYSLKRNCHYNITATITQSAESTFTLNIEYEVLPWTSAGNGNFEPGAVTTSGKWETGTDKTGNLITVSNNTSVTYEFTLSFPPGATWIAQLTNFHDFDFDMSNNGVREGITAEGIENKIRIRPRAAVSTNDVMTEFYITVFNGIENVEVNLTGSGIGEGNRFIIKQNPN